MLRWDSEGNRRTTVLLFYRGAVISSTWCRPQEGDMDDSGQPEHPRGALLFILIYLLLLVALWIHVYLRLWVKG
jgi:hypothetical protein